MVRERGTSVGKRAEGKWREEIGAVETKVG
jgi:hypothetical protein